MGKLLILFDDIDNAGLRRLNKISCSSASIECVLNYHSFLVSLFIDWNSFKGMNYVLISFYLQFITHIWSMEVAQATCMEFVIQSCRLWVQIFLSRVLHSVSVSSVILWDRCLTPPFFSHRICIYSCCLLNIKPLHLSWFCLY